jgi:ribosomal-protein-alanine N-acetyltransferase
VIETTRLILRSMTESDLEGMFAVFSDKNVLAAFDLACFGLEQMERWVGRNLAHQKKHGYGLFSVILKSSGDLIGDCGLEHTDFEGRPCVEIGYDFLSRYWNQGYATEAAGAVRDFAVKELGLDPDSICSFIRKKNKASQRVSEKIGMQMVKEYASHNIDYLLYAYSAELAG